MCTVVKLRARDVAKGALADAIAEDIKARRHLPNVGVRPLQLGQDLLGGGHLASGDTGVEPSSIRRLTCNAR